MARLLTHTEAGTVSAGLSRMWAWVKSRNCKGALRLWGLSFHHLTENHWGNRCNPMPWGHCAKQESSRIGENTLMNVCLASSLLGKYSSKMQNVSQTHHTTSFSHASWTGKCLKHPAEHARCRKVSLGSWNRKQTMPTHISKTSEHVRNLGSRALTGEHTSQGPVWCQRSGKRGRIKSTLCNTTLRFDITLSVSFQLPKTDSMSGLDSP